MENYWKKRGERIKPSELFYGAWKALLKNKKRSILTMLGIIIGISAVSTIISIGRGFQNFVSESLTLSEGDNVTTNIFFEANDREWMFETKESLFTREDIILVESIDGVKSVKLAQENWDVTNMKIKVGNYDESTDINLISERGDQVKYGRSIDIMDIKEKARVTVIPIEIAVEISDNIEEVIGSSIKLESTQYTIIGIIGDDTIGVNTEDDFLSQFLFDMIEIPRSTYDLFHEEKFASNEIALTIQSSYIPSEVSQEVIEKLEEEGHFSERGSYNYMDLTGIDDTLAGIFGGITLFIASVASISLFIAGIGVMNMMYISVSERTKEIGIRRAIGASQKSIQLQFVLEGILMTCIGGLIGYICGLLFAYIASIFLPFDIGIDIYTISISMGVSTLIGLVFSYAPASLAGRKEIIDIL